MFRGNNPATVDDKGRLKIPTAFQGALDEYGPKFFVTSLDAISVRIYPLAEWEKVEARLAQVQGEKDLNKAKREFLDRTNFWGQEERADPQGRVLIPTLLREAADIKGIVAVMGKGDHLEVGKVDKVKDLMNKPLSVEERDSLDTLGIW
jgi:MraZ protein